MIEGKDEVLGQFGEPLRSLIDDAWKNKNEIPTLLDMFTTDCFLERNCPEYAAVGFGLEEAEGKFEEMVNYIRRCRKHNFDHDKSIIEAG